MTPEEAAAVANLRAPETIRARCNQLLTLAEQDGLNHFRIDREALEAVAQRVAAETRAAYPDLEIPYHSRWRHLDVGQARTADLDRRMAKLDPDAQARSRFDLVVTSVLLDAGAGPTWSYAEPGTDQVYTRSEGLAVASYHLFVSGAFSSDPARPLQADADGLRAFTRDDLAEAFQVGPDNPLVGLEGRTELLVRLGETLAANPAVFGSAPPRVGGLYDAIRAKAGGSRSSGTTQVEAADVLALVLTGLGPIWPGRVELGGENLGDVWPHPALQGPDLGQRLVPFHKLSQWLTYSLLEPLEWAGLTVVGLDRLTALAEYRNGGLLVDLGALVLKDPAVLQREHLPASPLVVEWRALTVALMDELAGRVRDLLGKSQDEFPLAKVLEGGTWRTGRSVAVERRPDGSPPIRLLSDGTVF